MFKSFYQYRNFHQFSFFCIKHNGTLDWRPLCASWSPGPSYHRQPCHITWLISLHLKHGLFYPQYSRCLFQNLTHLLAKSLQEKWRWVWKNNNKKPTFTFMQEYQTQNSIKAEKEIITIFLFKVSFSSPFLAWESQALSEILVWVPVWTCWSASPGINLLYTPGRKNSVFKLSTQPVTGYVRTSTSKQNSTQTFFSFRKSIGTCILWVSLATGMWPVYSLKYTH